MQLEIHVDISEALKELEAANKNLKEKALNKVMKELNEARNNAREDAPYRTGTLRRSIKLNTIELTERWHIQIVALAPYASFLEFGTYKMKPRPFFYKNIDKAIDNIKRYLKGGDWIEN